MAEVARTEHHVPAKRMALHLKRQAGATGKEDHSSENNMGRKYVEEYSIQDVFRKDVSKYYDHFQGILVLMAEKMFGLQLGMAKG